MAKTVLYDSLQLDGVDITADEGTNRLTMRLRYTLTSSNGGDPILRTNKDFSVDLTVAERAVLFALLRRLKDLVVTREL